MISPPTFSFLACLSVNNPLDVETITVPYPDTILGKSEAEE